MMNALKLASLVSATLICLAPATNAQADRVTAEPIKVAGSARPGDRVQQTKTATAKIEEDGDQRSERAAPRHALELYLSMLDETGFRLEVNPSDEAQAWIVVCLDTSEGLVPVAILDARNVDQTTFHMAPEVFQELPLALFAARLSTDGHLEFSAVRRSIELVEEANRRR